MAWYSCPFEKGCLYCVKQAIAELGHNFFPGEVVRFADHSYDAKQGLIRFWFQEPTSTNLKAWHVWEGELDSLNRWQEFFEAK